MNDADVIEFAVCGGRDGVLNEVTLIVMKGFETRKRQTDMYLCAYIKELSGIIIQSDSWDENELIKQADFMYGAFRKFNEQFLKIKLPEKLNYTIKYVEPPEWLKTNP